MIKTLLLLLIFCAIVGNSSAATDQLTTKKQLLRTETVPKHRTAQGEVRLLLVDEQVVLQTVLYSKILKKVLAVIQRQEEKFWPPTKNGHQDSQLYIEQLQQSFARIWSHFKQRKNLKERRQGMLITLFVGQNSSRVEISEPQLTSSPGTLKITGLQLLQHFDIGRSYAVGSLLEISRETLDLSAADLLNLLNDVQPATRWLRSIPTVVDRLKE